MKPFATKAIAKKSRRVSPMPKANSEQTPSKDGGKANRYEDRTKDELYQKAKEVGNWGAL